MIDKLTASPLFGVALCVLTFELGVWLQKKTKSPLCNPLLIAIVLIAAVLTVFKIYEGVGEWFDLTKLPIERNSFSFGIAQPAENGYFNHKSP